MCRLHLDPSSYAFCSKDSDIIKYVCFSLACSQTLTLFLILTRPLVPIRKKTYFCVNSNQSISIYGYDPYGVSTSDFRIHMHIHMIQISHMYVHGYLHSKTVRRNL